MLNGFTPERSEKLVELARLIQKRASDLVFYLQSDSAESIAAYQHFTGIMLLENEAQDLISEQWEENRARRKKLPKGVIAVELNKIGPEELHNLLGDLFND